MYGGLSLAVRLRAERANLLKGGLLGSNIGFDLANEFALEVGQRKRLLCDITNYLILGVSVLINLF